MPGPRCPLLYFEGVFLGPKTPTALLWSLGALSGNPATQPLLYTLITHHSAQNPKRYNSDSRPLPSRASGSGVRSGVRGGLSVEGWGCRVSGLGRFCVQSWELRILVCGSGFWEISEL